MSFGSERDRIFAAVHPVFRWHSSVVVVVVHCDVWSFILSGIPFAFRIEPVFVVCFLGFLCASGVSVRTVTVLCHRNVELEFMNPVSADCMR